MQVLLLSGEPLSKPKTCGQLEWDSYVQDVVDPLLQADCTCIRMSMNTTVERKTCTNMLLRWTDMRCTTDATLST